MSSKKSLYIGNIPWKTTNDELLEVFGAHGSVENARIIFDKATGRSKGFAFIDVAEEDYSKVIKAMDGAEFGGRQIKVNDAKPMGEKVGANVPAAQSA